MSSVDETLAKLVSRGYPLVPEADQVHEGLKRLQTMLEREIDEAEALQAAGEWRFVADSCGAGVSPPSKEQAGRLHYSSDDAAPVLELKSEEDHDD